MFQKFEGHWVRIGSDMGIDGAFSELKALIGHQMTLAFRGVLQPIHTVHTTQIVSLKTSDKQKLTLNLINAK